MTNTYYTKAKYTVADHINAELALDHFSEELDANDAPTYPTINFTAQLLAATSFAEITAILAAQKSA